MVNFLNETLYTVFDEEKEDVTAPDNLSILLKEAMTLEDNKNSEASSTFDETDLLLKETTELYVSVRCLRCKIERRGIITFPCCHIALCLSCSLTAVICPSKDCLTPIASTLRVIF